MSRCIRKTTRLYAGGSLSISTSQTPDLIVIELKARSFRQANGEKQLNQWRLPNLKLFHQSTLAPWIMEHSPPQRIQPSHRKADLLQAFREEFPPGKLLRGAVPEHPDRHISAGVHPRLSAKERKHATNMSNKI